jgi:hypothetical protein
MTKTKQKERVIYLKSITQIKIGKQRQQHNEVQFEADSTRTSKITR